MVAAASSFYSDDYADDTTVAVTAGVSHSAGLDVLKLLARGQGPSRVLVVLGYSGWGRSSSRASSTATTG